MSNRTNRLCNAKDTRTNIIRMQTHYFVLAIYIRGGSTCQGQTKNFSPLLHFATLFIILCLCIALFYIVQKKNMAFYRLPTTRTTPNIEKSLYYYTIPTYHTVCDILSHSVI